MDCWPSSGLRGRQDRLAPILRRSNRLSIGWKALSQPRCRGPDRVRYAPDHKAATHNHFASKNEFISETLSRVWSDCQRVSGLKDGTAAAALNRFLGQYLSTAQCERSRWACLLPIALPDADKLPPRAREVLHAAILELTGQIQGLLAQLGEENPADAVALLMAELVGVVTFARAQPLATQYDLLAAARRRLRAKLGLLPVETTSCRAQG